MCPEIIGEDVRSGVEGLLEINKDIESMEVVP